MSRAEHRSTRRIQEILGCCYEVKELEVPTRTVAETAVAIGCKEIQFAKSLVFRSSSDQSVLVVACGINRVDIKKVSMLLGENIARASPDFVRKRSNHVIGGVLPVGRQSSPVTLLGQDLTVFDEAWTAAGTINSVFRLTSKDLQMLTGAYFYDVAQDHAEGKTRKSRSERDAATAATVRR